MRAFARRHSLILLLILAISQVSLTAHIAEHLHSQDSVCQLCHARGDIATAIPPSDFSFQFYFKQVPPQVVLSNGHISLVSNHFRARAPPHKV